MLRITFLFLIGLSTVACGDDDGPPTSPTDGGTRDSGDRDSGGGCTPSAETCDGTDDDCDGRVDEDADVACMLANAIGSTCNAGRCEVGMCTAPFGDCNGMATDGCETDTDNDPNNCGACMNDCGSAVSCIAGACANMAAEIEASWMHSCLRDAGGSVFCWGSNLLGRLGNGTDDATELMPRLVVDLPDAVEISAGLDHTCARRLGGEIVCWGDNSSRQQGWTPTMPMMENTNRPLMVENLTATIEQIDAGGAHTCALDDGGNVWCWGSQEFGQLGNGSVTGTPNAVPMQVMGLSDAIHVSAGQHHTCAVRRAGRVECWGRNGDRLGDAMTTSANSATPVEVDGLNDAEQVSAGAFLTCARRRMGELTCWGPTPRGDGMMTGGGPVALPGVTNALAVSAGGQFRLGTSSSHACSHRTPGVTCWGDNDLGQLGDGTTSRHLIPVAIMLADVAEVSAGTHHTCATLTNGDARCWGDNSFGQLGDGTMMQRDAPEPVVGF